MSKISSENMFCCLKIDFLSFFIYVLCYIYWFSRSVSNILSTTFNWGKWVKWVIQGQELNISLWNLFLWIQCPRIGVIKGIEILTFITKCSFWGSFCWVQWVKWATTWSKPQNFAQEPILLDSAHLNYVKKSASKALLKIAPNVLFL